ncbi:hypothetical protein C0995_012106 [Termitomyces sp. Mi166|nr:hypothetical protein C0995_012106 [Termitomyces sp. Mi166\
MPLPRHAKHAIQAAQAVQAPASATAWHVQVPTKSFVAEPASQPIANKTRLSFLASGRRARKQRAKKTEMFASQSGYGRMTKSGWRWRLIRFGEKLFGYRRSRKPDLIIRHHIPQETEAVKLRKIRMAEEARVDPEQDLVQLIEDYNYSDPKESSLSQQYYHQQHTYDDSLAPGDRRSIGQASQLSAPSIYSQMTGVPNRIPEPRQPLRKKDLTSRFSTSTLNSSDQVRLRTSSDHTKNSFWK